jgi:pimeloyl-ACP methyl ester carboxylesterase
MSEQADKGTGSITVLLVHGAFADSSGWNGVIARLQDAGVRCIALPNPLRGVSYDSSYARSAIEQVEGRVLLVGHSYGGAVITNAAAGMEKVAGLVYVAAFAPEEGESLGGIESNSKDSVLSSALTELKYPDGAGGTAVELAIVAEKFHEAFGEPSAAPAWRDVPSWAIVPTGDRAAGSDVLTMMAERANATITMTPGSHVVMVSNPQIVTDVVMDALQSLSS